MKAYVVAAVIIVVGIVALILRSRKSSPTTTGFNHIESPQEPPLSDVATDDIKK